MSKGSCSADVTFFQLIFNGPLETIFLSIYWTDLTKFQNRYTYGLSWSIRPSFRDRSSDVATVTNFWRQSPKIGIPHLHSVRWHSTTD